MYVYFGSIRSVKPLNPKCRGKWDNLHAHRVDTLNIPQYVAQTVPHGTTALFDLQHFTWLLVVTCFAPGGQQTGSDPLHLHPHAHPQSLKDMTGLAQSVVVVSPPCSLLALPPIHPQQAPHWDTELPSAFPSASPLCCWQTTRPIWNAHCSARR